MKKFSHLKAFTTFFRIGLFTIGGGYAMIPLIEREVVEKNGWLEQKEFVDSLAIAQALPGPMAVNASIFVGYKLGRFRGAIMATLGTVLPSFLVMLGVALFFTGIKDNRDVMAVFRGIRPAVVALIAGSVYGLACKAGTGWRNLAIASATAAVVWLGGVSPAYVILVLAFAGSVLLARPKGEDA